MSEINAIVAKCDEIQKSLSNFATEEKVAALASQFSKFEQTKRAEALSLRKHRIFGDHEAYSAVANAVGKALVQAGNIESKDLNGWLTKANASINQTDSGQGATFLPTSIDPVISKLVQQNGIARNFCRIINGVKGTHSIKQRATRVTVGGVSRPDGAISLSGPTFTPVNLTTYEVGLITTVEEKLINESPVDLVEAAISDIAEAAAEFEDDSLFAGAGTYANLGMTGLNTATTGVGGSDQTVAYGSFSVDDALNVRAKVHTSVFGNGNYFMHPYVFASLQTKKASTAGSYFFDISSGSFKLGGSDIVFAPRMDSSLVLSGKVPVIYGDLSKAVVMGLGRNYEVRVLNELYAASGQIGIRVVYDAGMVMDQSTAVAKVKFTS